MFLYSSGHEAHSPCCATVATVHLQNFFLSARTIHLVLIPVFANRRPTSSSRGFLPVVVVLWKLPQSRGPYVPPPLTNPPAARRGPAPEDHHVCCRVPVPGRPAGGLRPPGAGAAAALQPAQHPQEPHGGALLLPAGLRHRHHPDGKPGEAPLLPRACAEARALSCAEAVEGFPLPSKGLGGCSLLF